MSLGLGHNYWVHQLSYFTGSLDQCIKFMIDNPPVNHFSWYELTPLVVIKKGQVIYCDEYRCCLVEDGSVCKK